MHEATVVTELDTSRFGFKDATELAVQTQNYLTILEGKLKEINNQENALPELLRGRVAESKLRVKQEIATIKQWLHEPQAFYNFLEKIFTDYQSANPQDLMPYKAEILALQSFFDRKAGVAENGPDWMYEVVQNLFAAMNDQETDRRYGTKTSLTT